MKYLLYLIIIFTASVLSFAHAQELHHEEKLKISIPFGEVYDYKNIKVTRVVDGDDLPHLVVPIVVRVKKPFFLTHPLKRPFMTAFFTC